MFNAVMRVGSLWSRKQYPPKVPPSDLIYALAIAKACALLNGFSSVSEDARVYRGRDRKEMCRGEGRMVSVCSDGREESAIERARGAVREHLECDAADPACVDS